MVGLCWELPIDPFGVVRLGSPDNELSGWRSDAKPQEATEKLLHLPGRLLVRARADWREPGQRVVRATLQVSPVAYNVLKAPIALRCLPYFCHMIAIMPLISGTFETSKLTDILRTIVDVKQTGYLKISDGEQEGCLAVEYGVILQARAGAATGLPALFQFVGWREAKFEFHERPMPADLSRDLAVYDPQVLITGVAFKVDEMNLLHEAIPSLDSVLYYAGGDGLASLEVTSADLGLLAQADGHRTVREIAQQLNMNPMEVARNLARFRFAGVLGLVKPKSAASRAKIAMAAAG